MHKTSIGEDSCQRKAAALPLATVMQGLSLGTTMLKVRSNERGYRRKYQVDVQNMRISYAPSHKPFWKTKTTSMDLHDLDEVRKGWNSDIFLRLRTEMGRRQRGGPPWLRHLQEDCCLTLVFGPEGRVLDLVAPDAGTRDAWVRGLDHLVASCSSLRRGHEFDRWLREQVRRADVNGNGRLNFEECLLLLNQLNINMSRCDARRLFDASDVRRTGDEDALDPDEFVTFYRSLVRFPELERLMIKYSVSGTALWGGEELQNFLQKEQNMNATLAECGAMIEKYEPEQSRVESFLSLRGFRNMLLSVEFNAFQKKHRLIHQDMKQPLSHYYIASSHNTYLVQDQFFGESSIEGYIRALNAGCRCIELDVWDGEEEDPVVVHGRTLTSRLLLRDALHAIRRSAFFASQYPVILSIENHCSVSQQAKMAQLFTSILGEYLYTDPVGENETQFPSPEDLARKILIKAKKLKNGAQPLRSEQSPKDDGEDMSTLSAPAKNLNNVAEPLRSEQSPEDDGEDVSTLSAPMHSPAIAPELSDLVNYCTSVKFRSLEQCRQSWRFCEMASFDEGTALDLGSAKGAALVAHNKIHLSRVYPHATRLDSSNYDPVPHWNCGCQMVALNYQTHDEHMFIHQAMFAQNGNCGYVLKPKYLRRPEVTFEPWKSPDPTYELLLLIKVICGQYIPKPGNSKDGEVVDPYVSLEVLGHPLDKQKKKTKHVQDNGFNPAWDELVEFRLCAPQQAVLVVRVKDERAMGRNELLGRCALPIPALAEGYRYVHLQDLKGQSLLPAAILLHVRMVHGAAHTSDRLPA